MGTISSLLPTEMGSASLLGSLLLCAFAYQALSQVTTSVPCCQTKNVVNAPAGKEALNGNYVLKPSSSSSTKPDPNCADGCIYTKGSDEYCFMNVPLNEAADVKCDAGTPAAGGTTVAGGTPVVGGTTAAGGTPAVGGTTAAGGTPAVGGTTASGGTTPSLSAQATDAN